MNEFSLNYFFLQIINQNFFFLFSENILNDVFLTLLKQKGKFSKFI